MSAPTFEVIPQSYLENLLMRNQFLGMPFASGWAFAKVILGEDIHSYPFERYSILTTLNGNATIGTVTDYWHEWQTANSEKYYWETEGDKVLQVFLGIFPASLRHWYTYPDPTIIGNMPSKKVDITLATTTPGFINGIMTPYWVPTTFSEVLVPKELLVKHGIFNPEPFTVGPNFNVVIRRLRVKWLNPEKSSQLRVIEDITADKPKQKCKFWNAGLAPVEYDVIDKLGIAPYKWEVD